MYGGGVGGASSFGGAYPFAPRSSSSPYSSLTQSFMPSMSPIGGPFDHIHTQPHNGAMPGSAMPPMAQYGAHPPHGYGGPYGGIMQQPPPQPPPGHSPFYSQMQPPVHSAQSSPYGDPYSLNFPSAVHPYPPPYSQMVGMHAPQANVMMQGSNGRSYTSYNGQMVEVLTGPPGHGPQQHLGTYAPPDGIPNNFHSQYSTVQYSL